MFEPHSKSRRLSKGTIERTRLLERLAEARRYNCVLIQGPAGSGKTTLTQQWRAQVLTYGYDFAEMTVTSGDDCDRVFDALFSCLDRVDRALAREAAFVYNRDNEASSTEVIGIALLRGVMQHPRDLVLLIDDYHLVEDARIHRLMQTLIDFAPPGLHLFIVSRNIPPLSFARLRDKNSLLEIDFRDLRFTFGEVEELLRSQCLPLQRRDARVLYDMTDGWIAGLRLLAMTLRSRPGSAAVELRSHVQNACQFGAYFNREVLERLSPKDVDALTRLAATPRFSNALCVALFGEQAGQQLLERLKRDNLFLLPLETGDRELWYRLHPLFRDLLQERFDALPQSERQRTHSAIGAWFGHRRHLREAVHHCVAAGEVEQAADWLDDHARDLFLNGELRRLVRAMAELPLRVTQSRPSLRLWIAWSQLCYRQLGACRETLHDLKASLSSDEHDGQHHLTLLEGSLAIQADDTEGAERLIPRLDAMVPARDAILTGGRRNILGWLHAHRGDFTRARESLSGFSQLLESGEPLLDSAFGALMGECLLGLVSLREGDMRQAERRLRDALHESDRALGPFSEATANASGLLAAVLYEINDLEALRALLDSRIDLIERIGLPDALSCATVMRSRLHRCSGSMEKALADTARLEEIANQRSLDRMLSTALSERTAIHLASGNNQAAADTIAELRFVARRKAGQGSAAALEVDRQFTMARCAWLAAAGREEEALHTSRALSRSPMLREHLGIHAELAARMAVLEDRLGHEHEAIEAIANAWRLAQKLGLVRSLLDIGDDVIALGERAIEAGVLDDAGRFHLEQTAHQSQRGDLPSSPPAQPIREPLSEREITVVKALAAALPNKRVGMALGISPETVKWHLKNVYSKLGVYGRDGAVARARELGYLDTGH